MCGLVIWLFCPLGKSFWGRKKDEVFDHYWTLDGRLYRYISRRFAKQAICNTREEHVVPKYPVYLMMDLPRYGLPQDSTLGTIQEH